MPLRGGRSGWGWQGTGFLSTCLPLCHTRLKCYGVVALKATAFKPEHAGQLHFYLAAADAQAKASDHKPIGVAEYQLLRDLPDALEQSLPSIADIEAELAEEFQALRDLPESQRSGDAGLVSDLFCYLFNSCKRLFLGR